MRAIEVCRSWPRWTRVAARAIAGVVLLGVIGTAAGGCSDTTTATTGPASTARDRIATTTSMTAPLFNSPAAFHRAFDRPAHAAAHASGNDGSSRSHGGRCGSMVTPWTCPTDDGCG